MKRSYQFLFLFSILFVACQSNENVKTLETNIPNDSMAIEVDSFYSYHHETINDSIKVELAIEMNEEKEPNLVIEMQLFGDSWIATTEDENFPYGSLQLKLEEQSNVSFHDTLNFTPKLKYMVDPNWDEPYRVITEHTILSQPLKINSSSEFRVKGSLFFVLEPICTPNEIIFELIQDKEGRISVH